MLSPFVTRQAFVGVKPIDRLQRDSRRISPRRTAIGRKPVRILRPKTVHHKSKIGPNGALRPRSVVASAKPWRPRQRENIKVEIARLARTSRPWPVWIVAGLIGIARCVSLRIRTGGLRWVWCGRSFRSGGRKRLLVSAIIENAIIAAGSIGRVTARKRYGSR